jgi:hypothetical protein
VSVIVVGKKGLTENPHLLNPTATKKRKLSEIKFAPFSIALLYDTHDQIQHRERKSNRTTRTDFVSFSGRMCFVVSPSKLVLIY